MAPLRGPESLLSLIEQGVIDAVVRPLMSGKEAQVYLVAAEGERYVAKVYKKANDRTFRHRSAYTEGRRVRNTRDQRAIGKHSRFGRSREEATWRSAEVDAIYRLRDAGVRVPEPRAYVDDVLVMELVTDRQGLPAPRLADVSLHDRHPPELFETLLREVVKMLCAGLVHADLSEFNVLLGATEPVVIDLPQAVDAAANRNARELLLRDVGNLTRFFGRYVHGLYSRPYGEEMWDLYERGQLTPDSTLTGRFQRRGKSTDVKSLLAEMGELEREFRPRREVIVSPSSRPARGPRREATDQTASAIARPPGRSRRRGNREPAPDGARAAAGNAGAPRPQRRDGADQPTATASPSKRRRRRRRRTKGKGTEGPKAP